MQVGILKHTFMDSSLHANDPFLIHTNYVCFQLKTWLDRLDHIFFANQPKIKHKLKPWRNFWKYKPYYSSTSENHLSFWNNARTDSSAQTHAVIQQWNNYINEQDTES